MKYYTCPVCGYSAMPDPPKDFNICPCCGTEFEYHDARRSHEELRQEWLRQGARWFSEATPPPEWWDPYRQLALAGLDFRRPQLPDIDLEITGDFLRAVESRRLAKGFEISAS